MIGKKASAAVVPVRQRTQYSCVAASLAMALQAIGVRCDEDSVDKMLGAVPGHGSAWDQAISTAQYFGARVTLMCPCTIDQLKAWTDRKIPVLIGWCPEGRPWGHASCVFEVRENDTVLVADPNIPDPDEVVREVQRAEFYRKWYEPGEKFLTRRTAMAVERDIPRAPKEDIADLASAPAMLLEALTALPDLSGTEAEPWKLLRNPQVASFVKKLSRKDLIAHRDCLQSYLHISTKDKTGKVVQKPSSQMLTLAKVIKAALLQIS